MHSLTRNKKRGQKTMHKIWNIILNFSDLKIDAYIKV